jgi:NAD(P)-dependent dehydrogenase (short-subunit alcohol dehydrogenase family)
MHSLNGKVALVTGAGRGIGRAVALSLAKAGADIALTARNTERLQAVAKEVEALGRKALPVAADITQEADVEKLFAELAKRFGRLDLLINNAGAFDGGPLENLTLEAWENVMAVNLRGPFLCTRAAFKIMKPQRSGRILNIGSISGVRVRVNTAAYATSKHGLTGLTQVAALEGREFGITCGCIHPGNTKVERRTNTGSSEDDEPMMEVEDLASVIALAAALPPEVNMLETTILPRDQLFVGRG